MADILNVTRRETSGTKKARDLRAQQMIPGVVYSQGNESIPVAIPGKEIESLVRKNIREVELQGDLTTRATVKAVQWDELGTRVSHIDLVPVSADA